MSPFAPRKAALPVTYFCADAKIPFLHIVVVTAPGREEPLK